MNKLIDFAPYPPTEADRYTLSRAPLPAAPMDVWAFPVEKAHLAGREPEAVDVCLVAPRFRAGCNQPEEFDKILTAQAGALERYSDELFADFTLQVGDLTPGKQFAVLVEGYEVFGTFVVPAAPADALDALQAHLELFGAKVTRRGSTLALRLPKAYAGQYCGAPLEIGLGTPAVPNFNSPSLTAVFRGKVTLPARACYPVLLSPDVEEGNVFELNGKTHVASASDTAQTVRAALLGGADSLCLDATAVPTASTQPGNRTLRNTNRPSLTASYLNTDTEGDNYLLSVGADVEPGNAFSFFDGSKTVTVVAVLGSTAASILAQFPSYGAVKVPTGTDLALSAVPGQQVVTNTNSPFVIPGIPTTLPAETVDEYLVTVGDDIRQGNVYNLQDTRVVAGPGQRPTDVVKAFGGVSDTTGIPKPTFNPAKIAESIRAIRLYLEAVALASRQFVYRVPTGVPVMADAQPGTPMTADDVAEVTLSAAAIRCIQRQQVKGWVDFGCTSGLVCIGLRERATGTLLSVSNPVLVDSLEALHTVVVGFGADKSRSQFGYEWGDNFSAVVRVPAVVRPGGYPVTEGEATNRGGDYRRPSTRLESAFEFVTRPLGTWAHEALSAALKHERLWVNGEAFFHKGDYTASQAERGTKRRGATAQLLRVGEDRTNRLPHAGSAPQVGMAENPFGLVATLTPAGQRQKPVTLTPGRSALLSPLTYAVRLEADFPVALAVTLYEGSRAVGLVYVPPTGPAFLPPLKLTEGQTFTLRAAVVPRGCGLAAVTVASWACQQLPAPPPDFQDGDFAAEDFTFVKLDCLKTGWKVPATVSVGGAAAIPFAQYVSEKIPQGFPVISPVYDQAGCGCP